MPDHTIHPASCKDPAGFVFRSGGIYYRQVNTVYKEHYERLLQSGLYQQLAEQKYVLPHKEINENLTGSDEYFITLQPEQIPFISYPYEWCFDQLKDAALLTLQLMKQSIEKGMVLKDATPFNIQFISGKPVFIDTLSFEIYDETKPWIAYRQFCESFLFPLLLGKYTGVNSRQLMQVYFEGIPAEVTTKLLPFKSRLNPSVWLHVFLQNKLSKRGKHPNRRTTIFSKTKLLNLVTHLESITRPLRQKKNTTWSNYYNETILSGQYLAGKEKLVERMLENIQGRNLLDLGANDGYFSLMAAGKHFNVIAADADEQCINNLYKKIREKNISNILPLCIDLTNPTPALGFNNKERAGFTERAKPDIILALALVHHLAIGKNIPLTVIAAYFAETAPQLIIEFVPKEDEKTQQLLQNKKDIYAGYSRENFETVFGVHFFIHEKQNIPGTARTIYLMKRK